MFMEVTEMNQLAIIILLIVYLASYLLVVGRTFKICIRLCVATESAATTYIPCM